MAAAVRGGDISGVIFHTDKGGEYTGDIFAETCKALGVVQSMGRVGSALDNAPAESFNSTLEWELLSRRHFVTKDQARKEVARFIDRYNHQRRHSSCEMQPPVVYEQDCRRPGRQGPSRMRTGFTRMALTTPKPAPIVPPCRPMRNFNQLSETLHDSRGSPPKLKLPLSSVASSGRWRTEVHPQQD